MQTADAVTALVSSTPSPGTSVDAIDAVLLRFDAPVDPAQLHLWLELDVGLMAIGPAVHTGPDTSEVSVALPPLGTGAYAVGWHLLAPDGSALTGTVPFSVGSVAAPIEQTVAAPASAEVAEVAALPLPPAPPPDIPLAVAVFAVSVALTLAMPRRPLLGALGIGACAAVVLATRAMPVIALTAWTAVLAVLFAAVHPGSPWIRSKEPLAR
jgi:methionine-rich copper-binding protein CopC